MTLKEIETAVIEEVEESEEFVVCNDCERELDEEGTQLVETEASAEVNDRDEDVDIHLCSACRSRLLGVEETPEYVEQVNEWQACHGDELAPKGQLLLFVLSWVGSGLGMGATLLTASFGFAMVTAVLFTIAVELGAPFFSGVRTEPLKR